MVIKSEIKTIKRITMTLALLSLLSVGSFGQQAFANGGDGGNQSGFGAAADFFGYFLAGGNPFGAIMEMNNDEEVQRSIDRTREMFNRASRRPTHRPAPKEDTTAVATPEEEATSVWLKDTVKLFEDPKAFENYKNYAVRGYVSGASLSVPADLQNALGDSAYNLRDYYY